MDETLNLDISNNNILTNLLNNGQLLVVDQSGLQAYIGTDIVKKWNVSSLSFENTAFDHITDSYQNTSTEEYLLKI